MASRKTLTAGALAAAVLIPLGAPAAGATGLEGGLEFAPPTWSDTGNGFAGTGGLQFSPAQWEAYGGLELAPTADLATQEQQQLIWDRIQALQGPPERLEQAAQVGQVIEAARDAQQAEQAAQAAAEVALPAADVEAPAEVLRVVEQLGQAGPAPEATAVLQTLPVEQVDLSLLEVTWDEMVGEDTPEGEENTAATAAWRWLQLHGWRGDPTDGQERLLAPAHPDYGRTVLVGELEETWCFPILPGSDVTDHVADLLRAAGWQEADVWGDGVQWLLPPEFFG